ncbi:hypothetical protein L195_g048326 [Trifolium pratense]|uniref:Uncharacterized protein n=1 Tax=Trifolium pratense TaxID=57577 RepID=A0A2K3JKY7_TRIPR|nr:hypothetical protein L195_g048326 [Trifolium pratense]
MTHHRGDLIQSDGGFNSTILGRICVDCYSLGVLFSALTCNGSEFRLLLVVIFGSVFCITFIALSPTTVCEWLIGLAYHCYFPVLEWLLILSWCKLDLLTSEFVKHNIGIDDLLSLILDLSP